MAGPTRERRVYVRFAIFFGIMLVLVIAGHVYLYRRLVRDTTTDERTRLGGRIALLALGVVLLGGRLLQRTGLTPLTELTGALSYVWMGLALFLVMALMALGGAQWIAAKLRKAATPAPATGEGVLERAEQIDEGRRLFLARAVAGGAVTVASSVAGYGAWRAYYPPEVSEVVVKLPRLPKALEGFTIVQLTDIHVGNLIERRFLLELVREANAQKPDLVAVTGDLVDGDVPTLGPSVSALRELRSRFGTYFVTGNHEYYSGVEEWTGFLPSLGMQVLRNRRVSIGDRGGAFDLLGVDDWLGSRNPGQRGYDLDAAMAGLDPERASVLLAHQPANFDVAAGKGIDLQLSGHTHGGQLFPMTLLVGLAYDYTRGLYARGGSHIYVSRGCGFWGPPMRVGSPPEIVKLVLTT